MKMIYLMGKSSAGKDTIYKILKDRLNINSYVMYTTRPMRDGEQNGVDYYYISNEEMEKYIQGEMENELLEYRTYQTQHGPWTYATIKDEQFKDGSDILMTGTLESYTQIKNRIANNPTISLEPIYIEVPDDIRLERAIKREKEQKEPKYAELCRRFLADTKDFSEENLTKAGITKRFQNNDLYECVKEITEYLGYLKTKEKER